MGSPPGLEPGARFFTLHHTPYTLHPTLYTLHPTPYTLHPTLYTLHPTHFTPHPTPYELHPTPYTPQPTPCTLHPTPYTIHRTPYTLHFTLHPSPPLPRAPAVAVWGQAFGVWGGFGERASGFQVLGLGCWGPVAAAESQKLPTPTGEGRRP